MSLAPMTYPLWMVLGTCNAAILCRVFCRVPGVLGFLVRVAVSEEWHGVKEVDHPTDRDENTCYEVFQ